VCKDRRPEGRGGGRVTLSILRVRPQRAERAGRPHDLRVGGEEHQSLREFDRHTCCALVSPPPMKKLVKKKKALTLQWHAEYTTERDAPHLYYYCITRLLQLHCDVPACGAA
jgi:hypothetical protein